MKATLPALCLSLLLLVSGCSSSSPKSFSQGSDNGWASVEVRSGLESWPAWDSVLDLMVRSFDIEMALREDGYIRTDWSHTWSGVYKPDYRVRVTIKFTPDRQVVNFLAQAQSFKDGGWRVGSDARLISTVKTDLMGLVGRTTR